MDPPPGQEGLVEIRPGQWGYAFEPSTCPAGHSLDRAREGWQPCDCPAADRGHRIYHCMAKLEDGSTCWQVVLVPSCERHPDGVLDRSRLLA